jgi:hypothetical protein
MFAATQSGSFVIPGLPARDVLQSVPGRGSPALVIPGLPARDVLQSVPGRGSPALVIPGLSLAQPATEPGIQSCEGEKPDSGSPLRGIRNDEAWEGVAGVIPWPFSMQLQTAPQ